MAPAPCAKRKRARTVNEVEYMALPMNWESGPSSFTFRARPLAPSPVSAILNSDPAAPPPPLAPAARCRPPDAAGNAVAFHGTVGDNVFAAGLSYRFTWGTRLMTGTHLRWAALLSFLALTA